MKQHRNRCSLLRLAFQLQLCLMYLCHMLDDGQSQASTPRLTRVALVHPVKALKHMRLMLLRDTNAGVLHRAADVSILL